MRGQFDPGFGAETYRGAVDHHHIAGPHFEHEVGHVVRSILDPAVRHGPDYATSFCG
jgi:hypothetical protein